MLQSYSDFPITPALSVLGGASQHQERLAVEEPAMTNTSNAEFATFSPSGALQPGHLSASQSGTGLAPGLRSTTVPMLPLPGPRAPEGIARGHAAEQQVLWAGALCGVSRSFPWCPAPPAPACGTARAHDQGISAQRDSQPAPEVALSAAPPASVCPPIANAPDGEGPSSRSRQ